VPTKKLKSKTNLWNENDETIKPKFPRYLIFSIANYGSETWTMSKKPEQKINAFEMRCYRKILRVQWTEKRTNVLILQHLI